MNEPQLSAEMEKRFDDRFPKNKFGARINIYYSEHPITGETQYLECSGQVKHFLATALEEQRQKVLSEVEGWLVDEEIEKVKVSHVSARRGFYIKTKDPSAYVRNKLRAELVAKLNQLKEGK